MTYSTDNIKLSLDRTYCNGHRLFCDNTYGVHGEPKLPFETRRSIIEDLCDYFETKNEPSIFVLDETDEDRQALERLFEELISQGNRLIIEYDSSQKRELRKDKMYLDILKSGKKLSINGTAIGSVEEYWIWKRNV